MNQQVGRYKILGKLGKGAMGVVYLAEDPKLNRRVAIKTVELAVDDPRSQDFLRDRLVRDGRAAASLSHPNIVSVYDVLEEGDFGYLVMEYISGESLAARLSRTPLPDVPFIARVLREMASALDYTHARGIIHRDIKPANVMLAADAGGSAKIMDFGIARINDSRTNTPTGMVMGTLEYMAPEQIKGEPVDGRADQFSLAAVAYEMLTGNTLFGAQQFATLAYKIVNEMPVPPRTYNPGLPPGVDEVVARALRKPPAERFQSCGGFVAALERAFAGEIPATGQLTQAMFVAPLEVTGAPPTAPLASTPPAVPAGSIPTAQASAPLVFTGPAGRTTAPLAQMAPPPPVPAASRLGLLVGTAGVLAAMVMGGALLLWKPWAPRAGQPPERAAVPTLPAPAAGQSGASPSQATPLPVASPPPPVNSASGSTPATPEPPQGQPSSAQAQPQPLTPGSNSASAEPSKRTPPSASESANDTAPDTAVPSEPDPAEGAVPQPARAAFREGAAMIKADRYPAAIQKFSKAIELKPDFLRAYSARGAAYLHVNRPADAFADYAEILRQNPHNAIALSQRGICHSRLHDEDAAMADFDRALEIRPNIPGALNGRGLIFFHRKQYPKAMHEFSEAIRVSPEFGWAYVNRARTEEAMGNQSAADADRKKARELGLDVK